MSLRRLSPYALAALLGAAGAAHFRKPKMFDELVPGWLPGEARDWTRASGVAELALAAAVAVPATRRVGALAGAGFFVAVFPANVKMALDWRDRGPREKALAYGRLPLQVPLVLWSLGVAKRSKVRRQA
ncbi:DoxX family protein [Kitasatospora mediocidica]|uniref:DoxX family protein n=1 Tax=Kitasatospora mediocidica TaxID=58352 RepID=UPI00055FC65F|nr:membrane protein [Kitasatospora mediocidica]